MKIANINRISSHFELNIGDYQIKKTIGEGAFSKVKLAIHKQTKQYVAIKVLDKQKVPKNDLERFTREMQILISLNHPNVIQVNEILENKSNYYIVMEYCAEGDLFNYIVHKKRLSEEETSFIFYQIINGLNYIHSQNISHRDLKPENILMLSNRIVKIIDFGLSNYYNIYDNLTTPCGSPCYAAPEMIQGKGYNGCCVDIWSTGIIVYAMICGYLPFEDKSNQKLFKKILKVKQKYPSYVSANAKDILNKMLCKEPSNRITMTEIKRHPFYLEGKNIFNIKFNPTYDYCGLFSEDEIESYGRSYFKTTVNTEHNQDKKNKIKDNNNNSSSANNSGNNNNNNNCIKICERLLEEEEEKENTKQTQEQELINKKKIATRNSDLVIDIIDINSMISSGNISCSNLNMQIEDNNNITKHIVNNSNLQNKSVSINLDSGLDVINNNKKISQNKTVLPIKQSIHPHLQSINHSSDNTSIDKHPKLKYYKHQHISSKKKPITKLTTYNESNISSISTNINDKDDSHLIKVNVNKRLVLNSAKKTHLRTQTLTYPLISNPTQIGFTPIKAEQNCNMNLATYNKFKNQISFSNRMCSSLEKKITEFSMINPFIKIYSTHNNSGNKWKHSQDSISEFNQTTKKSQSKKKEKKYWINNDICKENYITLKEIKGISLSTKRTVPISLRHFSNEKRTLQIESLINKNRSKSRSVPKHNTSVITKCKSKNQSIDVNSDKLSKKYGLNIKTTLNLNSKNISTIKTNLKVQSNVISCKNNLNRKELYNHLKNKSINEITNTSKKNNIKLYNNEIKSQKEKKQSTNHLNNTMPNKCANNN
jgi:serine/threonine protein kinase